MREIRVGTGARRRAGLFIAALLVAAGCGDDGASVESQDVARKGQEIDAFVAEAIRPVLVEGPFRGRATGTLPIIGEVDETYEVSGDDYLEITASSGYSAATARIGETVFEWTGPPHTWARSAAATYDPLLGPGFAFGIGLTGLLDFSSTLPELDEDPGVSPATGWEEISSNDPAVRRFRRTVQVPGAWTAPRTPDAPEARLQEDALAAEFYRHAEIVATIDIDSERHWLRHTLVHTFTGSPDFPECGPLRKLTGTMEQLVEFTDVGVDFTIELPDPDALVEEHPSLGEPSDPGEDLEDLEDHEDAFTGPDGIRDFTGCPEG